MEEINISGKFSNHSQQWLDVTAALMASNAVDILVFFLLLWQNTLEIKGGGLF